MVAMRSLLKISPKLLDNTISMIASRTKVYTHGNHFDKAMSAVPVEFWASIEHLCLLTTYPTALDGMFIYSLKLRVVEVDLDWLIPGSTYVDVVTSEDFDGRQTMTLGQGCRRKDSRHSFT
jgi:hypothetical protein